MNNVRSSCTMIGQTLMALLIVCSSLRAQDASQGDGSAALAGELYTSSLPIGVPDPQKILPVRVLREFELGTALERFASTTNRLLERREKELTDIIWKVDNRTSITPVAIVVRDATHPTIRRLGARFDYSTKADSSTGAAEEHSSYIVDIDELKQLEIALNSMTKALDQSPAKGEVLALQYKSRSGFAVSLTLTQKGADQIVIAAVDKVSGNSKDKARSLFEESTTMVHNLINYLASF